MASHDDTYVAGLATSLRIHRPDALQAAEDELQRLRRKQRTVAEWVNNADYDHAARRALADLLNIPAPRPPASEGLRNGN